MKDWWSVLVFAGMFVVIFAVIPLGISKLLRGKRATQHSSGGEVDRS
jgi:hypothetical protein